jgi:DNA (cytosine-5)-methyltransferase 1
MTTLKIGSLFSGYGGLDIGVSSVLDAETAWVSDVDKGACKILAHRFPDVPNLGDITTIDWSTVEPVDIITGGFPCTDLSKIGGRDGLKPGTRSGLWHHMAHAISILRPAVVVAENVRGLLSGEATSDMEPCPWCLGDASGCAMRALGVVLADLAERGYDAQWTCVRASDAGAPHERERRDCFRRQLRAGRTPT